MGRRDAVQVTLEVMQRMRALEPRLRVTYEPGWETRGNGLTANYEGALVHHTASASSLTNPNPTRNVLIYGRPDLTGPLCNETAPACTVDAPWIHVIAANPANHAGASGGRSMGPLPVTSLFNPRVRGLEIDYAGTVPMLAGQLYVGHLWARANADVVGGGDIQRVRAHFETSITGKWDIGYALGRSYDMAAFRRDAASVSPSTAPTFGDDMAVISSPGRGTAVVGPGYFRQLNAEEAGNTAPFGPVVQGNDRQFDLWRSMALGGTTAVWSTTVSRTDATTDGKTVNVPALQELADAKTQAAAVNAQLAGFQAALAAADTGKGGVDVDAIRAAVDAAVRDSIQSIDVTVNTKAAQ